MKVIVVAGLDEFATNEDHLGRVSKHL